MDDDTLQFYRRNAEAYAGWAKAPSTRLVGFLAMLPADRKYTLEFREESWFHDDVYALLHERDIPMCIIDQPDFSRQLRLRLNVDEAMPA